MRVPVSSLSVCLYFFYLPAVIYSTVQSTYSTYIYSPNKTTQAFRTRPSTKPRKPQPPNKIPTFISIAFYRLSPELDNPERDILFCTSHSFTPLHVTAQRCSSDGRLRPSNGRPKRARPRPRLSSIRDANSHSFYPTLAPFDSKLDNSFAIRRANECEDLIYTTNSTFTVACSTATFLTPLVSTPGHTHLAQTARLST